MQLQILRRTPSRPDLPSCQRRHPQMLPARLRYLLLQTLHLPQTLHLLQTRHPRRVLFPEDPRSPVRQKQELRLRASPHQLLLQKLFLQGRVSLRPDLRSWNAEGRTDKATQYMLDKVGVRNIYVLGQADGEGHAWNIVQLDGANYELDTTWGDPLNDDGSQTLTYNYFCITTEEMSRNHTRDGSYVLPTCTATDCDYYRHEGLFFDYYDIQVLLPYLIDAALNGEEFTLKFADSALLNQAEEAMFGDAFELEELNKELEIEGCRVAVFWHSVNEEMNTMNISFDMES